MQLCPRSRRRPVQGQPLSHANVVETPILAGNMPVCNASRMSLNLYLAFPHEAWGRLRADTPLTLSEVDLTQLRGLNERVSLAEVVEIYLPLSRLLNLYVAATQELYRATATFLGSDVAKVPYVIGMAGSVAVGKSTTARILQALLSRWPHHPKVDLVTTDAFLYPNRVLEVIIPSGGPRGCRCPLLRACPGARRPSSRSPPRVGAARRRPA